MWAVYKKEMRQYLLTPLAWIVWVCFLFLAGWVFQFFIRQALDSVYGGAPDQGLTDFVVTRYFGFNKFILLFVIPILSMRLFAEEKQSGTLELLFTYPLTEIQMIFGKLLAALTVACIMVGLTLPPIFWASKYGALDWSVLACTLVGIVLLVTVALSIGIFASSLTGSQVVAFIITLITLLALWLAAPLTDGLQPGLGRFVHELSLIDHFENFGRGIINSSDVIFYLSLSAFFLFLTAKQLESRKWRGTS
ncbi:MAG: hypothetical protein EB084_21345 [Proteobacteria bacterium]|nr:hypothetical protein [Pseudomonadota bacterium]